MLSQNLKSGQVISGFIINSVREIPELRCEAIECLHVKSGAKLIHLYNDDPNNLFCIAFRTPVFDNTGVPHILEHSVLAGSRKFPVKDPFKEMLKGSLQTFLNAMTYPDKTIYPVSSQSETDFFNLTDVYCDAVFHPRLDRATFCQEGWHFDAASPDGPIGIKGIVYNEMKGVFSDFRSHVSRRILAGLFPDTTYAFDSGGEPSAIPALTYEQFTGFHRKYYHPSNSFIFLCGNIPAAQSLRFLDKEYLSGFDRIDVESTVSPQTLWQVPRSMSLKAPSSREDDGTASVVISWISGNSTDPVNSILGPVLSRYLLGTESSPLRRALIDSGLGEDLDGMSGYDADLIQGFFSAGLRRTRPGNAEAIERLVLDCLQKEVNRGMDSDLLEGSIRQVEFGLREISNAGHFPHNLMLAERCYRSWIYGGDPFAHLAFEKPLSAIKKEKQNGTAFFSEIIKTQLAANSHRLTSVVEASAAMGEELGILTENQAASLTNGFSAQQKQECARFTHELLEIQKKQPDPAAVATLPRLDKNDLDRSNRLVLTVHDKIGATPVYAHPIFCGGVGYLDAGFSLENISVPLLGYFPLYSQVITRCGAAGLTAEQMAVKTALNTGGIYCSELCSCLPGSSAEPLCKAVFHGKALIGRFDAMTGIMADIFRAPKLDDPKLVKDTLLEMRNDFNSAILNNGHVFASGYAASRLSASRYVSEQLQGISQLRFLESLVALDDIGAIIKQLELLHNSILSRSRCFVSITSDSPSALFPAVEKCLSVLPEYSPAAQKIEYGVSGAGVCEGIEISSSVNFVARAWRLGEIDPQFSAGLQIISKCLSTGYLWEKVRVEGGAYGGKAFHGLPHPVFMCASYRDPNVSSTLTHFQKALEFVANGLNTDEVEQSIIGTIGAIDHPQTPHAMGYGETVSLVCGRNPAYRQQIREAVLASTPESLSACAGKILVAKESAVTVLGSAAAFDKAAGEGVILDRKPLVIKL
jgi:Zn-dependent M16 (insulinase) family peptidase